MEMSERYLLRLTRMLGMAKYQESEPRASQNIFIGAPQNRAVGQPRAEWTHLRSPMSGRRMAAMHPSFKSSASIFNSQVNRRSRVKL